MVDKSVPQLTWETTTGVSSSSKPKVNAKTVFHNRKSSMGFRGAQTAVTKCSITKMKLTAHHHYPMHVQQGFESALTWSQPMATKLNSIAHRSIMAFF